MPYRHAHYYLLLLFPLTGLAFWPNYFSTFSSAPMAFHVHGLTASLWIVLLALQSWSIHHRRNAMHRAKGYSSFLLFPLFLAGGLLVIQSMAQKFASGANPFYGEFGARLGTLDMLSSASLPFLFYAALKHRRKVHLHARYLLVTVFFLLAPIISRLLPILPPLAINGPEDFRNFEVGVHLSNAMAIAMTAHLYLLAPKHGRPYLIVGGLIAVQSVLFETVGRTQLWESAFAGIGALPASLLVSLGLAAGVGAAWAGWVAGLSPARAAAAAR